MDTASEFVCSSYLYIYTANPMRRRTNGAGAGATRAVRMNELCRGAVVNYGPTACFDWYGAPGVREREKR